MHWRKDGHVHSFDRARQGGYVHALGESQGDARLHAATISRSEDVGDEGRHRSADETESSPSPRFQGPAGWGCCRHPQPPCDPGTLEPGSGSLTRYTCPPRGPLAQLGERRLCTAEVRGSTPLRSTSAPTLASADLGAWLGTPCDLPQSPSCGPHSTWVRRAPTSCRNRASCDRESAAGTMVP